MRDIRFEGMAAVFLVSDVRRSAEYYRDSLGFHFDQYWGGDPPAFCVVRRGVSGVMLVRASRGVNPNGAAGGYESDAYIWVDDIDALAEEMTENGAEIARNLENASYGMREFTVKDPDGYHICFGAPPDGESRHAS